jgi:aspartokinase/homoserine dehydrogenase 1
MLFPHYSARPEKKHSYSYKNTFEPEAEGTYISNTSISKPARKRISHIENITLITLEGPGMIGVTGSSRRLLKYYH